jgi:hypothetical protein
MYQTPWSQSTDASDKGFTLVEMLVAIAVLAILMTIALLSVPNHDDRYWRDNLDQLVASLNMAQEESALSGTSMLVQIDATGWRYASALPNPINLTTNNLITAGGYAVGQPAASETSGLVPDVYRARIWHKPVVIESVQLTLGGETIMQSIQIPITQEQRRALLMRASNGRFTWVNGVTP